MLLGRWGVKSWVAGTSPAMTPSRIPAMASPGLPAMTPSRMPAMTRWGAAVTLGDA